MTDFAPVLKRQRPALGASALLLQRKCAACGSHRPAGGNCAACDKQDRVLQRRSFPPGNEGLREGGQVPPIVHDVLRSSGRPLGEAASAFFEPRFGHDFSGVQVHTDGKAAKSARAVGADAYTVGSDIVFAAGKWNGAASSGLLAHELAHVVQQSGSSAPAGGLSIAGAGSAAEREADMAASEIMADRPSPPRIRAGQGLFRQAARGGAAELGTVSTMHATPTSSAAATGETSLTAGLTKSMPPMDKVVGSAVSISWIDPQVGLPKEVSDPAPPSPMTEQYATGNDGFRFSNYLHAWVSSADHVHIDDGHFFPDSGLFRGPSYQGIPSKAFATQRNKSRFTEAGIERMEFEQVAGARTVSAGVIGGFAASTAAVFALLASHHDPRDNKLSPWEKKVVKGAGQFGTLLANTIKNFPPIWTRLKLTLTANGGRSCKLDKKSDFPSCYFYCDLALVEANSALTPKLEAWEKSGWDGGNPWGESRPTTEP